MLDFFGDAETVVEDIISTNNRCITNVDKLFPFAFTKKHGGI